MNTVESLKTPKQSFDKLAYLRSRWISEWKSNDKQ